jgi:hypothetical protein
MTQSLPHFYINAPLRLLFQFLKELNEATFSGSMFELSVKKQTSEKKASLAISSSQILEVTQNSPANQTFYIHGVHQLHSLAKVQFRRGISITFQFQSGLTKSYRITEAVACCEYLKKQMKSAGLQVQQFPMNPSIFLFLCVGSVLEIKPLL